MDTTYTDPTPLRPDVFRIELAAGQVRSHEGPARIEVVLEDLVQRDRVAALSLEAAAKYAGVCTDVLREACRAGALEHGRGGRNYVLKRSAIDRYLRREAEERRRGIPVTQGMPPEVQARARQIVSEPLRRKSATSRKGPRSASNEENP